MLRKIVGIHMKENEEKVKKLGEILHYLTSKIPGLTRTQLVKLAYLIDRKYYVKHTFKMTSINYYMYFYGPYCDEFEPALNNLKSRNLIHEEFANGGYRIFFNQKIDYTLEVAEKEFIDTIIKFAKEKDLLLSAKKIKEYVYDLPEVLDAKPMESLNFDKAKT